MIKTGVLYPRSSIYPLIGEDFLAGIRASVSIAGIQEQVEILTEPIGFGSNEKEVYQKTENLLFEKKVNMVIGFLDLKVTNVVQPLFTATRKKIIVVNPGANCPENWLASPGTYFLTLLDSFLCHLTGRDAKKNEPSRAVLAASFYDGGYHHCHSLVNGFTRTGGSLVFNYISPQKMKELDLAMLDEFLHNEPGVRTLLCSFSGEEALLFYELLGKLPYSSELELFVSPAMLEEQYLSRMNNKPGYSVTGHIPWVSTIDNRENKTFRKTIFESINREANVFSLLGWECGLVLKELLENKSTDDSGELINNSIKSPRGELKIDPESHYFLGGVYSASLTNNGITLDDVVPEVDEKWEDFKKEENDVSPAGWLNTYLCY